MLLIPYVIWLLLLWLQYIILTLTELLMCVSFCSKHFICIESFNSYKNLIRQVLLFYPILWQGKWDVRSYVPSFRQPEWEKLTFIKIFCVRHCSKVLFKFHYWCVVGSITTFHIRDESICHLSFCCLCFSLFSPFPTWGYRKLF